MDILVNNARRALPRPRYRPIVERLELRLGYRTERHVVLLPGGGAIINMIATYAASGAPGVVHSGAAKAGVLNLTQTLAVEWAPYKIRVSAITPGLVATETTTE